MRSPRVSVNLQTLISIQTNPSLSFALLCLLTDENKPQLDHIQADFVTSAVLGVVPHHNHKSGDVRRLNGVIPRMNITPNPLAQDPTADKVSKAVFQLCSIICYSSFHRFHLSELQKHFRWLVGQNSKRFLLHLLLLLLLLLLLSCLTGLSTLSFFTVFPFSSPFTSFLRILYIDLYVF